MEPLVESVDTSASIGFRIARWAELYEPPVRDLPRGPRKDGPLRFCKLLIEGHAHDVSGAYRDLMDAGGADGPAAFGLFCKLLELAGNEPRALRDGTIYSHRGRRRGRPANLDDLVFYSLFPRDLLVRCLDLLVEVTWLETFDADAMAHRLAAPSEVPAASAGGADRAHAVRTPCARGAPPTETETENRNKNPNRNREQEHQPTEQPPGRGVDPGGGSAPGLGFSASASGALRWPRISVSASEAEATPAANGGPEAGDERDPAPADSPFRDRAVRLAVDTLSEALRIDPRTEQGATDVVTLLRMASYYLDQPTRGAVRQRWRELVALARSKRHARLRNRMAAFTAACIDAWGHWPEHKSRLPPARAGPRS